jgi:Na+-driven multidrug efflux pump
LQDHIDFLNPKFVKPTVNISTNEILKLAFPAIIAGIAEPVISIADIAIYR